MFPFTTQSDKVPTNATCTSSFTGSSGGTSSMSMTSSCWPPPGAGELGRDGPFANWSPNEEVALELQRDHELNHTKL